MKQIVTKPVDWGSVTLGVSVGALLLFQNYGMFVLFPDNTPYWVLPSIVILYSLTLLGMSISQVEKVEPWAFPAVGALLWETWWLLIIEEPRRTPIIIDFLLVILTFVGLIFIIKQRQSISPPVAVLSAVILLATSLLGNFRTSPNLEFIFASSLSLLNVAIHSIPFLVLGLTFARQYGSLGILIIVVCEPFLIEKLILGDIGYQTLISESLVTQAHLIISQVLPFLTFLILLPMLMLRSENSRRHEFASGLISLIVISVLAYSRVFYLQEADVPFSLSPWAMWGYFVIVLWFPILLGIVLYRNFYPSKSAV